MSVPLDRLYDFLHDLVNRDIIIYRWSPHGSKNLSDLNVHDDRCTKFLDWARTPKAVFHDQEPLDYYRYSKNDFLNFLNNLPKFQDESDDTTNLIVNHPRAFDDFYESCDLSILFYPTFSDKQILVHSERNSKDVELYQQVGFVPVYYWSHSLIARDWFRYAKLDPALQCNTVKNVCSDFLIYNRAWSGDREYRLYWAQELINQNLVSQCKTSFSPFDNNLHYTAYQFKNPKFQITRTDLDHAYPKNTAPSTASADYNVNDYLTCGIEVVLETLFDTTKTHLTEKTLRPIACGQPFMLVAPPDSLEYLRSYGFVTFNGLIDESYDTVKDPKERLHCVLEEMRRISAMSPTVKTKLFAELGEISRHNRTHFFSDQFYNHVINEFTTNFSNGYRAITECTTAHRWHKMHNFVVTHLPEHYNTVYPILDNGVDEYSWSLEWLKQRSIN